MLVTRVVQEHVCSKCDTPGLCVIVRRVVHGYLIIESVCPNCLFMVFGDTMFHCGGLPTISVEDYRTLLEFRTRLPDAKLPVWIKRPLANQCWRSESDAVLANFESVMRRFRNFN